MMIDHLNSIPIYIGHVKNYRMHVDILDQYINDDSYFGSVNGWVSDVKTTFRQDKNRDLPWQIILEDLNGYIQEYLEVLSPVSEYHYKTHMWMNRYSKGEYMEPHDHISKSDQISFAYILNSQGQNNFVFENRVDWINSFDNNDLTGTVFTNIPLNNYIPEQKDGTLLIFPSSTIHYVTPNTSDGLRITISGNISIKPGKHFVDERDSTLKTKNVKVLDI